MDFKVANSGVNIKVNTYGNSSNNNFKFNVDTNFNKMNHKMYSYDDIPEIDFSKDIVYNNVDLFVKTGASVSNNFVSSIGANISNIVKSAWVDETSWWSDVSDWWNKDAVPWIKNASKVIGGVLESTGATIVTFTQSLVEGVGQFGEAIVDFVAIIGTGVASIVTGLIDGGQAIYGAVTGNEWESVTKKMWGGTMSFVSTQYVSGWFDSLYYNTDYGKWLKEKSYGFDITRSIGSGIGYVAGVVALTIATAGAGSVAAAGGTVSVSTATAATTGTQIAITAGIAGMGKGTQNAWADGADLGEGLVVGGLTGLWEGAQFYIGGKIGGTNLFGSGGGTGIKVLNSLGRVALDGLDGGVEGFVQPMITSIYKDGYYDENGNYIKFSDDQDFAQRYMELFDDNGGWTSVWTQAAIGGASSAIGEAFNLGKYFKDSNAEAKVDASQVEFLKEKNIELDRLRNNLYNDNVSSSEVTELLYKAFEDGNDAESLKVLKAFNAVKEKNPNIKVSITNGADCYWSLGNLELVMGYDHIVMGDKGTMIHELGHCLFDSIDNGNLPSNFYKTMLDAGAYATSDNKVVNLCNELNKISQDTWLRATRNVEDSLGISILEYSDNLKKTYYSVGITDSVEVEELVSNEINNLIHKQHDIINRTEYGDYCAISDIVDDVFWGCKADFNGNYLSVTYQHGEKYYSSSSNQIHELVANFTQLKVTGNESSLNIIKDVFGEEFYNMLENIYAKFN